jgi:plastocyanin domain-containing protein
MKSLIVCLLLMFASVAVGADEVPFIVPMDKEGVQRVEILGGDYYFKPSHIVVKVNQPVELLVRKDGWFVPHDFVIDAPEAGIKVNESLSQDPKTIAFTPTKVGTYPFYCDKKALFMASHRKKGMEGVLEVVE